MMTHTRILALLCISAGHALAQQSSMTRRPPIIDVHIHAFGWDHQGNPPSPNPLTGKVPAARTDKALMDAVLAELRRFNVVKVVAGGRRQHVLRWLAADSARIIGGVMVASDFPLLDLDQLREDVRAGRVGVMGELALAYHGVSPSDPRMEPYWALAEMLDIPVLQETIAIMHMYPQVYADLGAIDWLRPRETFHDYLRALVRAGFAKRLMFGSDHMIWPEGIGKAIEGVESASFLTDEQKRDIFFNNAVRFLRLDEKDLRAR